MCSYGRLAIETSIKNLISVLHRNAPFEAATGDPARRTETCEYEPCVNLKKKKSDLALRSWNKVKFLLNIVY